MENPPKLTKKQQLVNFLVRWFKAYRDFDNYTNGKTDLCLDGNWDMEELAGELLKFFEK